MTDTERLAIRLNEYLHSLDGTQPLTYYMARGLSLRLAELALAHPPKED